MNLLDLMVKIGVDDQASDKVGGIGSKITGTLGSAAKVAATAATAAVAAVGAITTASLNAYATYEQQVGGIKKLYGDAWEQVAQDAKDAYTSCGLSANDYMQQASSFSASLIQSLGGDTAKAASQAQVAMKAMSDNVNTFGTDMTDVQNAFQGFAKQNYTMLDNLKLGYGGTKSEMERLISDANEYAAANGEAADLSIDSFSDIVTAIELVQEKQGIAGTTAKEAATTIEGSVNTMKAAWDNWLTSLGAEDYDLSETTEALIESVENVASNVVPRVQKIVSTAITELPGLISGLAPSVVQFFQGIFDSALETLWSILPGDIQAGLMDVVLQVEESDAADRLGHIFDTSAEIISTTFENLTSIADTFSDAIAPTIDALSAAGEVVADFFGGIADTVESNLLPQLDPLVEAWGNLCDAFEEAQPWLDVLGTGLGETLVIAVTGLVEILTVFINGVAEIIDFFNQFVQGISDAGQGIADFVQGVGDFLSGLPETVQGWLDSAKQSVIDWAGNISAQAQTAGSGFLQGIVTWFQQLPGRVSSFLSSVISSIGSFAGSLLGKAQEAGANFLNGIKGKFEEAVNFVKGIPGKILSALGNTGNILLEAGKSIINGLWNGLKSAWSGVTDWVSGLAGTIQSLKGPIPYDRKVLIPNGIALMESLQTGLVDGFSDVRKTVSAMAPELESTFGSPQLSASYVTDVASSQRADAFERTNQLLEQLLSKDTNLYIDGKATAKALVKPMNQQLGLYAARGL